MTHNIIYRDKRGHKHKQHKKQKRHKSEGLKFLKRVELARYTAHCTLYTENCTLNTAHCSLQTANCKLNTAHYTLHRAHQVVPCHLLLVARCDGLFLHLYSYTGSTMQSGGTTTAGGENGIKSGFLGFRCWSVVGYNTRTEFQNLVIELTSFKGSTRRNFQGVCKS